MIYLVIGDVGAGKSAYLVDKVIRPALEMSPPRMIYTNVRVKGELKENPNLITFDDLLSVVPPVSVSGEFMGGEQHIKRGALVVLDEGGIQLMSGMGKDETPNAKRKYKLLRGYLAQHRHFVDAVGRSTDIFIAAQETNQLTTQVRALISWTVYLRSISSIIGNVRGAEFRIYQGCISKKDLGFKFSPRPVQRSYFRPRASTFDLYDSHDLGLGAAMGSELVFAPPALRAKLLLLGVILFIVFASFSTVLIPKKNTVSLPTKTQKEINNENFYINGTRRMRGFITLCYTDGNRRRTASAYNKKTPCHNFKYGT